MEWLCERLCVCVCTGKRHALVLFFFLADKSCLKNRDATHQLLGQRESKLSVWLAAQGEWVGNQCNSQKVGLSNGHGWSQCSQWISGHSAMPKSSWLFSGSGFAAFQSLLSAHVCDSVLLQGPIFQHRNAWKRWRKIKSDDQSHTGLSLSFEVWWRGPGLTLWH